MIEHTHFFIAHSSRDLSGLKSKTVRRVSMSHRSSHAWRRACLLHSVSKTYTINYLCPPSSLVFLKYIQASSTCCSLSSLTSTFRLRSATSKLPISSSCVRALHPASPYPETRAIPLYNIIPKRRLRAVFLRVIRHVKSRWEQHCT
jgi:hypothetical protein